MSSGCQKKIGERERRTLSGALFLYAGPDCVGLHKCQKVLPIINDMGVPLDRRKQSTVGVGSSRSLKLKRIYK